MTRSLVGGHDVGLLESSATLLNCNDPHRCWYLIGMRDPVELYDANYRRQHTWTPLAWTNTASVSLSQIYSPLPLDYAIDLVTAVNTNRVNPGQVAEFDTASKVRFASATAGRVTHNAIRVVYLDSDAPNPEPVGLQLPAQPVANLG